jgi:hypothetical protein
MNAELLYTSAPSGLKQGSRGFCTVISSAGMPINLATKLESLSGYRHLFPSGTPDAVKNPICFSHVRFFLGGKQISVISRISDYGLDYSQRTNKIAHHIVVETPLPPSGPAALLLEPGLMRNAWNGKCLTVSAPNLPVLEVVPQKCEIWENTTGDAGWGGVVADAWIRPQPKPVFIIFSVEQSRILLSLLAESIALLPIHLRWQATFGTYITSLPPDVDCKVRCVIAGSDEARMATARGTIIDLTKPLGTAVYTDATYSARSGKGIGVSATIADVSVSNSADSDSDDSPSPAPPAIDQAEYMISAPSITDAAQIPPDVRYSERRLKSSIDSLAKSRSTISRRWGIPASIVGCLMLIASIAAVLVWRESQQLAQTIDQTLDTPTDQPAQNTDAEKPATSDIVPPSEPVHREQDVAPDSVKPTNTTLPQPDIAAAPVPSPVAPETAQANASPVVPRISADDFELTHDGFYLQGKSGNDESIPLEVGVPGATVKANLKSKEPDVLKDYQKNWLWEQMQSDGTWVKIQNANSDIFTVTRDQTPNSQIRARVDIVHDEKNLCTVASAGPPLRIYELVKGSISMEDVLSETQTPEDIEIRLPNATTILTVAALPTYRVNPFQIKGNPAIGNLERKVVVEDKKTISELKRKIKEIRDLEDDILRCNDDLHEVCLSKAKTLPLPWALLIAQTTARQSQKIDLDSLRLALSEPHAKMSRILEKYTEITTKNPVTEQDEEMLLQLLVQEGEILPAQTRLSYESYKPVLIQHRDFLMNHSESPRNNGVIPMKLFDQLMKQLNQYKRQLQDFQEKSVDIDTVDDAFSVVRKADKRKEDGLPTLDTNVASFGLKIQLTFTATHDPTSSQTGSSTTQRKAGDTRAKPLTGSPVK